MLIHSGYLHTRLNQDIFKKKWCFKCKASEGETKRTKGGIRWTGQLDVSSVMKIVAFRDSLRIIWERWKWPLNNVIMSYCQCDRIHMASIRLLTWKRLMKTWDVDALKKVTEFREAPSRHICILLKIEAAVVFPGIGKDGQTDNQPSIQHRWRCSGPPGRYHQQVLVLHSAWKRLEISASGPGTGPLMIQWSPAECQWLLWDWKQSLLWSSPPSLAPSSSSHWRCLVHELHRSHQISSCDAPLKERWTFKPAGFWNLWEQLPWEYYHLINDYFLSLCEGNGFTSSRCMCMKDRSPEHPLNGTTINVFWFNYFFQIHIFINVFHAMVHKHSQTFLFNMNIWFCRDFFNTTTHPWEVRHKRMFVHLQKPADSIIILMMHNLEANFIITASSDRPSVLSKSFENTNNLEFWNWDKLWAILR